MSVILALMAAAAIQAAPPADSPQYTRRAVKMGSLNIPDEIAPAVVPYMLCLTTSAGIPTYANGKLLASGKAIGPGTDCSKTRKTAARNANKMLVRLGRGTAAERKAFVEQTLVAIEQFNAASLLPPKVQSPADAED